MEKETELEVLEVVKKQLKQASLEENIGVDDDLIQLGMNSIIFIKIIVEVEDIFDIEFNDDDLVNVEDFNTVRKLAHYINKQIDEKSNN